MARTRSEYVCRACGYHSPRAMGRCSECGAWSSFDELSQATVGASPPRRNGGSAYTNVARSVRLSDIDAEEFQRTPVAMEEFSRVLGGGIVRGSVVLIGGDPGVGKSTLLTQVSDVVAQAAGPVVYVSGEESLAQVGLRARRLGLRAHDLRFASETDVDAIVGLLHEQQPALAIVDSIQSVMASEVDALPGSVGQLRECTLRLLQAAKTSGVPLFLVGHVTKEGAIAGPKVLEHMVDTVLYMEGERFNSYRLLRSTKNRFGPTHEVGVFEMRGEGLVEVANPSAVFLAERGESAPGSVVTVAMEGTRPLLVEVQALASKSSLAVPRRTANGFDINRLHLITAVLGRRLGVPLYDHDVYLNVVGGLRIDEPAADLAAALAIVSSVRDRALPRDLLVLGEVGLSGELRSIGQVEHRLREGEKLGFTQAVVPAGTHGLPKPQAGALEVLTVHSVREATRVLGL